MKQLTIGRRMSGLSLVELLIGMTLGLIVMAGVATVFTSTGTTNRTNENLARLQESARMAFSIVSRDVRDAGLNDCGRITQVMNVLNGAAALPWANWVGGLQGYEDGAAVPGLASGAAAGQRVGTEDAVRIMKGDASTTVSVVAHNAAGTSFALSDTTDFTAGDIMVACDFVQATIFQAVAVTNGPNTLTHPIGAVVPGNCCTGLGYMATQVPPAGRNYPYLTTSSVMRFDSVVWYIGNNGRPGSGGRSLYRQVLRGNALAVEEVLEGVSGMQLQYLVQGATTYVNAAAVADWRTVLAVRINLTIDGVAQEFAADQTLQRVRRNFTNVVALRNRVS
ncbi:MAG: PilW family protein [Rhodocyclaceae bacterium]|nr:PilW family protein [Rhodocyclaceae bacterium]